MRRFLAVVALVSIGSCEQATQPSPPPATPDPRAALKALAAVWASLDGSVILADFPRDAGAGSCVIHGGGPPPGSQVAGTCSTAVQRQAADWLVTFSEVWDARAFHAMGSAHDGPLVHTWQFTVDAEGRVVRQVHYGDFPPQLVF
jgi:hypothetical protein